MNMSPTLSQRSKVQQVNETACRLAEAARQGSDSDERESKQAPSTMLAIFGLPTGLPQQLHTCKTFARPRLSPYRFRVAAAAAETPVKRGRGRPKKSDTPAKAASAPAKRGRKKKEELPDKTADTPPESLKSNGDSLEQRSKELTALNDSGIDLDDDDIDDDIDDDDIDDDIDDEFLDDDDDEMLGDDDDDVGNGDKVKHCCHQCAAMMLMCHCSAVH